MKVISFKLSDEVYIMGNPRYEIATFSRESIAQRLFNMMLDLGDDAGLDIQQKSRQAFSIT